MAGLELGFVPTNVLSVGLNPELPQYRQPGAKAQFESELVSRVRQLPDVIAAGIGARPLGWGGFGNAFQVPGIAGHVGSLDVVGPGYLEALGGTLAAGRFFTADDAAGRPRVAIVNQAAAAAWWPGVSPLGKTLLHDGEPTVIVGVLADVRRQELEAPSVPTVYAPTAQMPSHWTNNLIVRTSGDARAVLPAVREVMRSIDREQALARIQTMEERLREVTAPRRQLLWLVGFFSALSLVLAIVGVYGVVAESVSQRIPEIGIRMALGATRQTVMSLILRQGLWLAGAGAVIGGAMAIAFNRVMSGFVFGVGTTDPSTYAAACSLHCRGDDGGMRLPGAPRGTPRSRRRAQARVNTRAAAACLSARRSRRFTKPHGKTGERVCPHLRWSRRDHGTSVSFRVTSWPPC